MTRVILGVGLAALTTLSAPLALAHPHLFVDVDLVIETRPDGQGIVHVTWTYDEFFSLLVTEDLGIDGDLDGVLTRAEEQLLVDFVTDWPVGFEGDVHAEVAGRALALGPVQAHQAAYVDGQVIERFSRALAPGQALAGDITLRVYDPGYYTAYTVGDVQTRGAGTCDIGIARADLIAATEKVDELLYAMPQDQAEVAFPEVGRDFADTVTIRCAG